MGVINTQICKNCKNKKEVAESGIILFCNFFLFCYHDCNIELPYIFEQIYSITSDLLSG